MARFCSFIASAVLFLAVAGGAQAGDIVVEDAVAHLTPSGSGGVFMTIQNQGAGDDSLVGVSSSAAKKAVLHNTVMVEGVMKMRPLKALAVPADSSTALAHGGAHVMLFGVSKDLKPGDSLDLVLVFEQAGEVPVTATIKAPGKKSMSHGEHQEKMAGDKAGTKAAMAMGPVEVPVHLISAEGVGESIGSLTLSAQEDGVLLTPALSGLAPGPHAFHVHKKPNCGPGEKNGEMVAGLAAGGHFDPGMAAKKKMKDKAAKDDGAESAEKTQDHGHGHKPAGDLPELMVGADGSATQAIEIGSLTLQQMMGRSIMIHAYGETPADEDLPKGGGARIACGVVPK